MIRRANEKMGYQLAKQAQYVLSIVNPLALTDSNKRLTIYNDAATCYSTAINYMFALFPKGYVDIPLLLVKTQAVRMSEAMEMCGRKQYASIHWKCFDSISEERIKSILLVMLKRIKCDFSENAFRKAISEVRDYLEDEFEVKSETLKIK